jgi:Response regulators consisting of a CheY-like receiver domain and a winged-helix DNA-binding domain
MNKTKILIVDDEKNMADSLRAGLGENGYEAVAAYEGASGMELFNQEHFDLLLLDINLEDINGFDICKKVRSIDPSVGIIMLTSLGDLENKITGYQSGADDYLPKPFEFAELLLRIEALMRRIRGAAPTNTILRSANLEMDLEKREVRRDDIKINLTAKEFHLLEYLLRNKNKVVTRADIAMHVWGIDFNTNTNVIDVYISYLRNKIDRNYSPKLIHTHTGVGFILKENDQ